MTAPISNLHAHLLCRQHWYADGCPGLEEGKATYFASGEVVLDAAKDLDAALALVEPTLAGRRYPDSVLQALAEFDAARFVTNRARRACRECVCERVEHKSDDPCHVRFADVGAWCETCRKREPFREARSAARKALAKARTLLVRRLDGLRVEPKNARGKLRRRCRQKFEETFPEIRRTARAFGYAVAVHGSVERDIDLIFAPWKKDAATPMMLAEAVRSAVGGFFAREGHELNVARRAPIGVSCMIHLGGGPYLDCLIVCDEAARRAVKDGIHNLAKE